MNKALIDSIQARLDAVYAGDEVKPVCTPFNTLGAEMVQRLPDVSGDILVFSDLGLLFAVLRRLHLERRDFSKVRFIGHTEAQMKMNQEFGVQGSMVCYNQLTDWKGIGMKFDVIVGNPPYQGDQSGGNKTHSLWKKFIKSAFSLINPVSGQIMMVTPNTWIVCEKTSKLFAAGDFKYAEFLRPEVFSVGVDISWWHWSAGQYGTTELVMPSGSIDVDIRNAGSIPTKIVNEHSVSIQKKTLLTTESFKIFSAPIYYANKEKTDKYAYPIFNTNAQQHSWAEKEAADQHDLKVVYSNCGSFAPVLDLGTRGTCWHSHSIKVNNEVEGINLIKILDSKLIKFLNKNNRVGGFAGQVFASRIPKIDLSRTWSDKELYDHFGLTQEECELIELIVN